MPNLCEYAADPAIEAAAKDWAYCGIEPSWLPPEVFRPVASLTAVYLRRLAQRLHDARRCDHQEVFQKGRARLDARQEMVMLALLARGESQQKTEAQSAWLHYAT